MERGRREGTWDQPKFCSGQSRSLSHFRQNMQNDCACSVSNVRERACAVFHVRDCV